MYDTCVPGLFHSLLQARRLQRKDYFKLATQSTLKKHQNQFLCCIRQVQKLMQDSQCGEEEEQVVVPSCQKLVPILLKAPRATANNTSVSRRVNLINQETRYLFYFVKSRPFCSVASDWHRHYFLFLISFVTCITFFPYATI